MVVLLVRRCARRNEADARTSVRARTYARDRNSVHVRPCRGEGSRDHDTSARRVDCKQYDDLKKRPNFHKRATAKFVSGFTIAKYQYTQKLK